MDPLGDHHAHHWTVDPRTGARVPEASVIVDGQRLWWCGHTEPAEPMPIGYHHERWERAQALAEAQRVRWRRLVTFGALVAVWAPLVAVRWWRRRR